MAALLEIIEITRSTYYYLKKLRLSEKYQAIKVEIFSIFHENKGHYDYRRITLELKNRGHQINHKTVQKLMLTEVK